MDFKFRLIWGSKEERFKNMLNEVNKLRSLFNAEGGDYMSLINGDTEFYSPIELKDEEIQTKLEENYSKNVIGREGEKFTLHF